MQSIKLHEATKQFKISNKLAMFFLGKKNLAVKSHSSVISMEQLELLREFSANAPEIESMQKEFKAFEKAKKLAKKKDQEKALESKVIAAPDEKVKTDSAPSTVVTSPPVKKEAPAPPEPDQKSALGKEKPAIGVQPSRDGEKKAGMPSADPRAKSVRKVTSISPEPKKTRTEAPAPPTRPAVRPISPDPAGPKVPPSRPRQRFRPPPFQRRGRRPGRGGPGRKKVSSTLPPKVEKMELPESIRISDFVTVKELSEKLNIKLKTLATQMEENGVDFGTHQIIPTDVVEALCEKLGVKLEIEAYEDFVFNTSKKRKNVKSALRAPVVTVMGHVDHGKTTLLDTLRKTRVAAREAGGITQSIGAYKLNMKGNDIIFIDTPGHEAFTNLRARGAEVTDIVVLVVAANDGVQPQTVEAINHARSANVPMIVAINKMDMEGADANRVKQELSRHEVLVEDWGGEVVAVEVSAKNGTNLDQLLEMILLVAEIQELRMYDKIPGRGTIVESRLDAKLGPIGTLLMLNGRIKRGDYFICGNAVGKIKTIFDDSGKPLNSATAPIPVEIMGFEGVPESGDLFQVVEDVDKARKVIEIRMQRDKDTRKQEMDKDKKLSLASLFKKMEESKTKFVPLVVKADNFGSAEVLRTLLKTLETETVKIDVVHDGVGNITESDILLASTSSALIIGFNVKAPQKILSMAKQEQIEIKLYNVIYHLTEELEKAIRGEIEPEYVETRIGSIEVLQKFKISRLGVVAGCIVREGKVTSKSRIKVIRGKDLVFEGELETLRRVKNEAAEVNAGTECGIKVKNFNAIEIGDTLEAYELTIKPVQ